MLATRSITYTLCTPDVPFRPRWRLAVGSFGTAILINEWLHLKHSLFGIDQLPAAVLSSFTCSLLLCAPRLLAPLSHLLTVYLL